MSEQGVMSAVFPGRSSSTVTSKLFLAEKPSSQTACKYDRQQIIFFLKELHKFELGAWTEATSCLLIAKSPLPP